MSNPRARFWLVMGVVLVLLVGVGVSACGGSSSSSSSEATTEEEGGAAAGGAEETAAGESEEAGESSGELEPVSVGFLPKQINNPYFDTAAKGGEKAAEEIGGEFKQVGPQEATAPEQVPFINTLVSQGVKAIALSANDPTALLPALARAQQQGVAVVTYDSDVEPEGRTIFCNQAEAKELGVVEVEMMAKQLPEGGEIAILSSATTATNQNEWIKFMEEALEESQYSKLKLTKIAYGNDDDQKSYQETIGLLNAYPNLAGIISPTTVGIAAAARALESQGEAGKVKLTGLGDPELMKKYVLNGTVEEFALWNPEELGYLAYYAATAVANGTLKGEEGETFEAGELGEKEVGAEGVVVLGKPTIFDKENIVEFASKF